MPVEFEIVQRHNLIRSSPNFVLEDVGPNGALECGGMTPL